MIDQWLWKLSWKTKIPTKVKCFSWATLKDAILTQDNQLEEFSVDSSSWLTDTSCIITTALSQSIICFYTVQWPQIYGTCSFDFVVSIGHPLECQRSNVRWVTVPSRDLPDDSSMYFLVPLERKGSWMF